MPGYWPESGVPSDGLDFTQLAELHIVPRDAERGDIGAMAHIFIKSFANDKTAQLLYPHDEIWPLVIEMLRNYLADDYTHVILAEDHTTGTIVGWSSISLVTSDQDDFFKYCDSTVWAGRQLLRRQTGARGHGPLHVDDMKRAALISRLRQHNREGQGRHAGRERLVFNTIAIHPEVVETEIPEIAYKLIDHARDIAENEYLPLWAQVPQGALGDVEEIFNETGFDLVGDFELDLDRYASEEHWSWGQWGAQMWTQWVLRSGNYGQGRRWE